MKKLIRLTAVALAMVMVFMALPVGVFAEALHTPYEEYEIVEPVEMEYIEIAPAVGIIEAIALILAAGALANEAGQQMGEFTANAGQDLNSTMANTFMLAAITVFGPIGGMIFNVGFVNGWHAAQ